VNPALDSCEKALEKNHPSTLLTIHNIGMIFFKRGEYDKALDWLQRALDSWKKALEKSYPSPSATINNMAAVFLKRKE
jgi:tetratricopeptide (TPR) repeat protein